MPDRVIPARLRERVGRRGLILLLFGVAWLVQGLACFLLPVVLPELVNSQPRSFFIERLPLYVQGALWLTSGALSIAVSLRSKGANDTLGFLAVSLMPMFVAASYLVGGFAYLVEGNRLWILGVLAFSIWAPIVLALAVVASWHEPRRTDRDA